MKTKRTKKTKKAKLTRTIGAIGIAALSLALFMPGVTAQDKDEVRLMLTGCVVAGEAKDSFMIKNMMVSGPEASMAPAGAFYRLDSAKGLAAHVGHKIEISGVADLEDLDKGTLNVKTDASGQATASVNSERRTVTAKVDASEVMPPALAGSEGSMTAIVRTYKFKVNSVKMLAPSCS